MKKKLVKRTSKLEKAIQKVLAETGDELTDFIIDQTNWRVIGGHGIRNDGLDDTQFATRERMIVRSRFLARKDPMAKQILRLYTTYSGILRVEFKSGDQPQLEETFRNQFWNLPANKKVLSPLWRRKLSLRLLSDGEIMLLLFPSQNGEVRVRMANPLDITFITHPEDVNTIIYYRRQSGVIQGVSQTDTPTPFVGGGTGEGQEVRYYRDKDITDEDLAEIVAEHGELLPDDAVEETTNEGLSIVMFYVPFDCFGMRGNGILTSILSYVDNYRNFIENRATIVRALATYIRTLTVDGGSKAVGDIAANLRSALTNTNLVDTNPTDVAGSTWVQNQAMDMEQGVPSTGAGEGISDARIFRQPLASGSGITEPNLTGDPSVGNLASQVQMEGPQLQNFLDFQLLWETVFIELWQYVLEQNNVFNTERELLDVFMPPVIRHMLSELVTALDFGLRTSTIPFAEASRQILLAVGSKDIDLQVQTAEEEREERQERALEIGQAQQQNNNGETEQPQPQTEDDIITTKLLVRGVDEEVARKIIKAVNNGNS